MKLIKLDGVKLKTYPKLINDCLSRKANLEHLHNGFIDDETSIKEQLEYRKNFSSEKRNRLVQELEKQYESCSLSIPEKVFELQNENTFTITTGHQLSLFGGPLFTAYKIASVINWAKKYSIKFPNCNIVPVFWLASEDHDFEEIQNVSIFRNKITWNSEQAGAVGQFSLDKISELIAEVQNLLGTSPSSEELIELLKQAYNNNFTLSQATRIFWNHFFKEHGLVIIDADSTVLKKEFLKYSVDEIKNKTSDIAIKQTNEFLNNLGYKEQAFSRPVNLFALNKEGRQLIKVEKNDSFKIGAVKYSQDDLIDKLNKQPDFISPNVILRPLYQEIILPNLAYIGGPGEISYWLQLKNVFKSFDKRLPLLGLRDSYLILSEKDVNVLNKLGFNCSDFFLDLETLKKRFISKNESFNIDSEIAQVDAVFKTIEIKLATIDPSLKAFGAASARNAEKILEQVKSKAIKALKNKQEQNLSKVTKLKLKFFPDGSPQERIDSFLENYAMYGPSFVNQLVNN